jgi:hypothetical protein
MPLDTVPINHVTGITPSGAKVPGSASRMDALALSRRPVSSPSASGGNGQSSYSGGYPESSLWPSLKEDVDQALRSTQSGE